MDIILQNDSGTIIDANSYTDVSFIDNYHALRGNIDWSNATEANKEIATIKAWQYIDTSFSFIGYEKTDLQNTEFPRLGLYTSRQVEITDLPIKLKQAQAEYALIALSSNFTQNETPTSGYTIKSESNKVDVLSESIEYDTSKGIKTQFSYPTADNLLADYVIGGINGKGGTAGGGGSTGSSRNTFNGYY